MCVITQPVLSVEQIPERKELFHGLADLTALKLLFKVLKAFLKDRLIQTTKKKKRERDQMLINTLKQ